MVDALRPVPGDLRRAFAYRRLVPYFARRLLEKRYARTWLGWVWIPLRPTIDIASRVLLFGSLLSVPSGDQPYILFFLAGTAAWQLLEITGLWATRSMELARNVYRKIYVPRLTALVAAVVPSTIDFLIYSTVLMIATVYFVIADGEYYLDIAFNADIFLVLGGMAMLVLLALVVGLFTSVFAARARDLRFTYGYALALWQYLTPVIYPLDSIPSGFQRIVELNPATAPVQMVKAGLLGNTDVPQISVIVTLSVIAAGLAAGLPFFLRWERQAADTL